MVQNALDASNENRPVRVSASQCGQHVRISIADEGPGMTDEERQRAFDPFWQSSSRHTNGSSGLGLAIVDQLARASNGTVALDRGPTGGIDATMRFARARSN